MRHSRKSATTMKASNVKDALSKATGKIHDLNMYGLLKEDWNLARKKLI